MRDLTLKMARLDSAAFDAELQSALPGKIIGVSARILLGREVLQEAVTVHLDDSTTSADEALITKLAANHNAGAEPEARDESLTVWALIQLVQDIDRRLKVLEKRG